MPRARDKMPAPGHFTLGVPAALGAYFLPTFFSRRLLLRENPQKKATTVSLRSLDIMTSDDGRLTPDMTRVSLPETRAA